MSKPPQGGHYDQQQAHGHSAKEAKQRNHKEAGLNLVSSLCLSVGFVVSFAFCFYYWQEGRYSRALWWTLPTSIFVIVAIVLALHPWAVRYEAAEKSRKQSVVDSQNATFRLGRRPRIGVSNIQFSLRVSGPRAVLITYKNTGLSPGVEVVSSARFGIIPGRLNLSRMPPLVDAPGRSIGVLDVNQMQTEEINTNMPLPIGLLKELESGVAHAYVYGVVKYRDTFDPKILPYETGFCYEANQGDLNGPANVYSEGNYAR